MTYQLILIIVQCSSQNIFKRGRGGGGGGEKSFVFYLYFYAFTLLLPPPNKASKQQVVSQNRENVQRCHNKAEFGKVKALDYLLQWFSMAPLAIQCVHLNHCRLTIDSYFSVHRPSFIQTLLDCRPESF